MGSRSWGSLGPILFLALAGCADSGGDSVVSLRLSAEGPTELDVGDTLIFAARAVRDDGSSTDVTDRATCSLTADEPPGRLERDTFVAERPGTTGIACTYQGVQGELGVTVRGDRNTPIAAIQAGDFAVDDRVQVTGVVFGLRAAEDRLDFWAQDEGGGPQSGIYFRDERTRNEDDTLPPLELAEGDVVRAAGLYGELNGRSIVAFESVEVIGTAEPVADEVFVADLDLATWDGCLVEVPQVVVTDPEPTVAPFAWEIADQDDVDGATGRVETILYDSTPDAGDTFDAIRGPVFPFDEDGEIFAAVAPRRASDLVGETMGEPTEVTPGDLRDGVVEDGAEVQLRDLVVVAVDRGEEATDFFAQTRGDEPEGAYFRNPSAVDAADVAVGDVVEVRGTYELYNSRHTVFYDEVMATGTDTPAVQDLSFGTDLRAHESTLVRLLDVEVTTPDVDGVWYEVAPFGGTDVVLHGETYLYDPAPLAGDHWAGLVGVVFCGDTRCAVAPRDASDVGAVSIADLRGGAVSEGAIARVDGPVTYALDPREEDVLHFFAQDVGGGRGTGIHFRDDRTTVEPLALEVGQTVRARGELGLRNEEPVLYFFEVETVGTAEPVATATTLSDLSDAAAEWAGTFVEVSDVLVSDASPGSGFYVTPQGADTPEVFVAEFLSGDVGAADDTAYATLRGAAFFSDLGLELWPRQGADLVPAE